MSALIRKAKASEWLLSQKDLPDESFQSSKIFETRAKTISIVSGKGGVGKTSIAVKLAKMISQRGYKTLLIDCDYNLSNTAVKLGLPVNDHFYEYVTGKKNFVEATIRDGLFHLFSGCSGNLDLFENGPELSRVIIDLIVEQERHYDYILLDCPAGISRDLLNLCAYTDFRFVVVTPDKSSVTDSYSLMKLLNLKYGVKNNHLIINKISSFKQYQRMVRILSETVENFLSSRLNVLGGITNIEGAVDVFDQILNAANSSLYSDFLNILGRFSEEFLAHTGLTSIEENLFSSKNMYRDDYGQDVQHMS